MAGCKRCFTLGRRGTPTERGEKWGVIRMPHEWFAIALVGSPPPQPSPIEGEGVSRGIAVGALPPCGGGTRVGGDPGAEAN